MIDRHDPKLEQLYLQMYPLLFAYARSMLSRDALAEEAVQNTFAVFCKTAPGCSETDDVRSALLNTLKNTISDMIRQQNEVRRILLGYLASCNASVSSGIGSVGLEITYNNIKDPEEFHLLKEVSIDKLSCLEIAEKRGLSLTACKKEISRAKELLLKHS